MTRAICALESVARWAVTGTPVQNRLGDLVTLLKFIRAHPYTDPKRFNYDITRLWKSDNAEEAEKRLKRLAVCLLLRRPKATISLPPREDHRCVIDFSPAERAVYETLRRNTIVEIDEALGEDSSSMTHAYANILQRIESLRLFCDLGLYYSSRHNQGAKISSDIDEWTDIAQNTFNSQRAMRPISCSQCESDLSLMPLDEPSLPHQRAQFTRCLKFTCTDCTQKHIQGGRASICGHRPPCPSAYVSTNIGALEEAPDAMATNPRGSYTTLPSKVEALISDIKSVPSDIKWYVFFYRKGLLQSHY